MGLHGGILFIWACRTVSHVRRATRTFLPRTNVHKRPNTSIGLTMVRWKRQILRVVVTWGLIPMYISILPELGHRILIRIQCAAEFNITFTWAEQMASHAPRVTGRSPLNTSVRKRQNLSVGRTAVSLPTRVPQAV